MVKWIGKGKGTMPKWIKLSGLARCGLQRPGLQRKSMSRGHFLFEFEFLWSTLELPDHLFDNTSKQGRKVIKNDVKMEAAKHHRSALASVCLHFAGSAVTWQALFALFAKSSTTLWGKAVFSYVDTTPTRNAMF